MVIAIKPKLDGNADKNENNFKSMYTVHLYFKESTNLIAGNRKVNR